MRLPTPRRRPRLGPGMVLALVAAGLVWHYLPGNAPSAVTPPRVEVPLSPPPSAPEPAWLLAQQRALALTSAQVNRLTKLSRRWDHDTAGLRDQLRQAATDFQASLPPGGGAHTMEQLQAAAAPMTRLSAQLAAARQAWWSEAANVLTPTQRAQAQTAWTNHLTRHFQSQRGPS